MQRYKARLVAQGFTQQYGIDFDETFCPVVRQEALRLLMALSVRYGLSIHQVYMTIAFLNGTLEDEVYMQQPTLSVQERRSLYASSTKVSMV